MRLLLLAASAVVAFGITPALGQSADPAKRAQWEKSMARCLSDQDDRDAEDRAINAQACKDFADYDISDAFQVRLREYLASKKNDPIPKPASNANNNRLLESIENFKKGNLNYMERHVRFTILEECLADPAGVPKVDCERIAGADRIAGPVGIVLDAGDEMTEEDGE